MRKRLVRTVYTLRWDKRFGLWALMAGGSVVDLYRTRKDGVMDGATRARSLWVTSELMSSPKATHTVVTQLRVRNKSGRWVFERTFGADPRRRKG